jgi:two-component system, LuxR family, sensor kinase FixL
MTFQPAELASSVLAAIVESSDDAIIGKDLTGTILTWNGGAERLYGYTAQEMIGRSIATLLPDGQLDELADVLARVSAGQRVEHFDTVRRAKDGHLVDVSLTVSPIKDACGTVVGASAIARDITARKSTEAALRTSEATWRSVVDSAVDGIIVIDAAGRIEFINRAAERLFGYTASEVVGRNVTVLMPAPYHEEHDGYLARYLQTGIPKIIGMGREVVGLRKDGTTCPVHLSVGEMSIGGARKFTGILHDLTARVRIEEQLRERTALARLGEMAAVIAHEVKNPLAAIRGVIQIIGGRLPPGSDDAPVIREVLARIDTLDGLVNDLLVFARPPQLKPGPVEVSGLVTATADLLGRDSALHGLQVRVDGSAPPIMADADLLKIVFHNLLVNGAHAMGGHGTLRVSVAALDGACRIAFTDSGPGIADPETRMFTPFFTTKSRGTGLGLPTAKRLVEAHRGTISIVCPAGGGTTVTVELPVDGQANP